MSKIGSILSFLILFVPNFLAAQDIRILLQQAAAFERSFKDQEALQKYGEVLKVDPNNLTALCKTSELYSILGKRQSSKDSQRTFYSKGQDFAKRALKVNPNSSEANFVMAISMGRMALISSGDEKIKAVKEIKTYADRCIQLDPNNYKGYHVLGKWHFEVSDLSSLERWLVKVTYGALPKASLADAIKYYEKSRQLNPGFLLNYLELAKAYERINESRKAKALLQQMLKLPPSSSDDVKIKGLGKKMLDDL